MVEVWKDRKRDWFVRVIDILYNSNEENIKGYNVWVDNQEVNQVTRSGKGYNLVEKKVEKAVKIEEVKEEDSDEPDDDLVLE